eukprot:TRINITY_DN14200_c0_g1_i2.p1 TRINITY_DN14200_c0_g1~~TRINITY_DN14200_c0_g1_i2.p1  ORF type:complete len:118 (+),score=8.06 TRINITY_DN14200_c0_g1_i2:96-449(+)
MKEFASMERVQHEREQSICRAFARAHNCWPSDKESSSLVLPLLTDCKQRRSREFGLAKSGVRNSRSVATEVCGPSSDQGKGKKMSIGFTAETFISRRIHWTLPLTVISKVLSLYSSK